MSNKKVTRRELLKALSALPLSVPMANFVQILVSGAIQKAYAQSAARKYVFFSNAGSPPRWMFDLLLAPYDTTAFLPNGGVATLGVADASGRYTGLKYATSRLTVNGTVINVPPLWAATVPTPSGTRASLQTLLQNFLCVRGVNVGIDGHTVAAQLGFQPTGATYTVMGLLADASVGLPMKAMRSGFNGEFRFSSRNDVTPTVLNNGRGAGKINDLLDPFTTAVSTTTFNTNKSKIKAQIDAAVAALDKFAEEQHPGAAASKNSRVDAEKMMLDAVTTLKPKWDPIYLKYQKLVSDALLTTEVPGLTDLPVGGATARTDYMGTDSAETSETKKYKFANDTGLLYHKTPLDIRQSITATSSVNAMAENFALAELCLTENISNCLALSIGALNGLTVNASTTATLANDQHFTGSLVSTLLTTKYWAAMGACLLEFVTVLKANGLFDSTVIHLGAEFDRSPSNTLGGSDHGWQANSATIISGMVSTPMVIGNILKSTSTSRPGTWGFAAPSIPTAAGTQRIMDNGDVANALAVMLGIPRVVKRDASENIIALDSNGKITSRIGLGKQV